jgi:hypothetical protein
LTALQGATVEPGDRRNACSRHLSGGRTVSLEKLRWIAIALVPLFAACTSTYPITMEAERPPNNESVVMPQAHLDHYKRIMVIPPSGTVRGEFDAVVALFERELLKKGITVTSGAITGRVVYEEEGGDKNARRIEGGAQLSDAERALVMAKKTNSDAILQIGEWKWGKEDEPSRWFIVDPAHAEERFTEVSREEFERAQGPRYAYGALPLSFIGRLIDVESGQVMAAYKLHTFVNFNLPGRYTATVYLKKGFYRVGKESFVYSGGSWIPAAKDRSAASVIAQVAESFGSPQP